MGGFRCGVWIALIVAGLSSWSRCAADEQTLRVMTFNIRYGTADDGENHWLKRKELLLSTIKAFQPDLLGTQEVLAAQADYLRDNLSGYTLVGVGRDDGKRRGEFSAVYFRAEKFELSDSGTFWLSETPEVPGSKSWDSSLPRVATWVRLKSRGNGQELIFLNTHWDHRGDQARVESAKMIRRWLNDRAAGVPAIITGDFNLVDSHPGYQSLLDQAAEPRLHDFYRQVHPEAGPNETTFHNFSGKRDGRRIDFILGTPQFSATAAEIDHTNQADRYPSDHYPVTAILRWATNK